MHKLKTKYFLPYLLIILLLCGNLSDAFSAGLEGYTITPSQNFQQNTAQTAGNGLNGYTISGSNLIPQKNTGNINSSQEGGLNSSAIFDMPSASAPCNPVQSSIPELTIIGTDGGHVSESGNLTGFPEKTEISGGLMIGSDLFTTMLKGSPDNAPDRGEYRITWTDPHIRVLDGTADIGNGTVAVLGKIYTVEVNTVPGNHIVCTATCSVYDYVEELGRNGKKPANLPCVPVSWNTFSIQVPENLCSDIVINVIISDGYPIWINDVQVTDDNGVNNPIPAAGGYVSYEPAGNTLYLVNAAVSGGIKSEGKEPLNIVLEGQNSISGGANGCGIISSSPLTISSFGMGASLTVSGTSGAVESVAVKTLNASFSVSQGTMVTAVGGTGSSLSAGVSTGIGTVAVKGSLTATGNNASQSYGINCGSLEVNTVSSASGGTVDAHGADALSCTESYGIRAYGGINVDYLSTLIATGGSTAGKSYGIRMQSNFSCAGEATCTSGNCSSDSIALYSEGRITSSGSLICRAGAATAGYSRGISARSVTVNEGNLSASALSGSTGSTGISCTDVSISGGTVTAEGTTGAFTVKPVFLQNYYPKVTVSDFSSSTVVADAALSQTYSHRFVSITSENVPTPTAPPVIPISVIIFDQETVSLSTKYGVRTVKYWYFPLNATQTDLSFGCTDAKGNIITVEADPSAREIYITSVGNGQAIICATASSGATAYCTVNVNGIGAGNRSYYFEELDNSGTWYIDWSDTFRAICTGAVSELVSVSIDGAAVARTTGSRINYFINDIGGKTELIFTRAFMENLARGKHTLALNYSTVGSVTAGIYVQKVTDHPRTGDESLVLDCCKAMTSAVIFIALTKRIKKEKKHGNG